MKTIHWLNKIPITVYENDSEVLEHGAKIFMSVAPKQDWFIVQILMKREWLSNMDLDRCHELNKRLSEVISDYLPRGVSVSPAFFINWSSPEDQKK